MQLSAYENRKPAPSDHPCLEEYTKASLYINLDSKIHTIQVFLNCLINAQRQMRSVGCKDVSYDKFETKYYNCNDLSKSFI